MQNSAELMDNLEQADTILAHMSATMEFTEEAIGIMDKQGEQYKYPMHVIALLRSATDDVRAILDESLGMIVHDRTAS